MKKPQPAGDDVRTGYQERICKAETVLARRPELETIRERKEAALVAHNEHRDNPPKFVQQDWHNERIRLYNEFNQAKVKFTTLENEIADAEREVAKLKPMLTAESDVKTLAKEIAEATADGETAQRRYVACVANVNAEQRAIADLKHKQQGEIDTAAKTREAAALAREEGKEPEPVKRVTGSITAEIADREADLDAALRLRAQRRDEIAKAAERTRELHQSWKQARALASALAFEQWQAEVASVVNEYVGTQRACGNYIATIAMPVDELEAQRIANDIAEECKPWRPAPEQEAAQGEASNGARADTRSAAAA